MGEWVIGGAEGGVAFLLFPPSMHPFLHPSTPARRRPSGRGGDSGVRDTIRTYRGPFDGAKGQRR